MSVALDQLDIKLVRSDLCVKMTAKSNSMSSLLDTFLSLASPPGEKAWFY
jgi:hypothetical protein